jgi:branched-chain amino acid transport system substrate-binding protein
MATSSAGEAALLAEWAYSRGFRTSYILLQTDTAFDSSFADVFRKRWVELAGPSGLLGEDTFAGEDSQIATQITRLKALERAPDVVVVSAAPPAGVSAVRQLRSAGINQPLLGSDSWDGDYWLSGVPGLSQFFYVTYASIWGTDPRPEMRNFFTQFKARFGGLPAQSNAVTGYSVIEVWSRAVERAHSLDPAKVRAVLDTLKAEPLLAGPTSYTRRIHINSARDMAVMRIERGRQGEVVGVFAAREVPN